MSSFLPRVWSQQQLAYCRHTSASGDTWKYIKSGKTTSAGAAGGTTLIDTGGDSGAARTYNGAYWVRCVTGANAGARRRIIDDDGSGTLTFENNGFDAQVASGIEYEILQSPDPVVVVTTSSGETNMVDTSLRSEPNDTWIGYYACPVTGARRGKKAKITSFTSATKTFGMDAGLGGALVLGDVVVLRKFIEVSGVQPGLEQPYIARPANRVNFSMGDGVVGARAGKFGFTTQVRASNGAAASGSKADANEAGDLFQGCGLVENVDKTSTVGAGSTTSAIKINTASWENHTVGNMVLWKGNAAFVTSLEDGVAGVDTINVTPALPVAPTSGETVEGCRGYHKSITGDVYGVLLEWEVDGIRTTMTGCKGNVTLQGESELNFAWSFEVSDWIRDDEPAPYVAGAAYSAAPAILASERLAYLDTTKTNVGTVTATPGCKVALKAVQGSIGINGNAGLQVTGFAERGTWRELVDSATTGLPHELRWTARTAKDFIVVYGSGANTCAVRVPVARHVESPHPTEMGGQAGVPGVFEAQDAGTKTDGASADKKVPDFAFFLS